MLSSGINYGVFSFFWLIFRGGYGIMIQGAYMPDQLPSDIECQKQKRSHSITSSGGFKIGILVILILLLLIPVVMIRSLITERSYRANNAEESIMEAWGSEFTLYGPVIRIPVLERIENRTKTE